MGADELRALLDRRPFEPIRLHISSGQTVDIKQPGMAFVTRSLVVVGVTEADERVADEVVMTAGVLGYPPMIVRLASEGSGRGVLAPKQRRNTGALGAALIGRDV